MTPDIGCLQSAEGLLQQKRLGHPLELIGAWLDCDLAGFAFGARFTCRLCGTFFHFKRERGPDQDYAWELIRVSDNLPEEHCTTKRIRHDLSTRRRWERLERHWKTLNDTNRREQV